MRISFFTRILLLFCLLLPHQGYASTFYANPDLLPPTLLAPPPTEGSPFNKSNIDMVIRAQKNVTDDARKAIREEQHLTPDLITSVLGPRFTQAEYPAAYALIDHVFYDSEAVTAIDKKYWHTRRPYLVDHRVKLMVDPIDSNPSYPSGHTSGSRVVAEVLAQLFPNYQEGLRSKASQIAWHRVQAGVHYPVDIHAGEEVAMLVLGAVMASPDYQRDFAAAQAEIAAKPLHP